MAVEDAQGQSAFDMASFACVENVKQAVEQRYTPVNTHYNHYSMYNNNNNRAQTVTGGIPAHQAMYLEAVVRAGTKQRTVAQIEGVEGIGVGVGAPIPLSFSQPGVPFYKSRTHGIVQFTAPLSVPQTGGANFSILKYANNANSGRGMQSLRRR